MGILDIFEPNRADFSPMTDMRGIYTRHIEQSVNVNIRTHSNDHLNRKDTKYAPNVLLWTLIHTISISRTIHISQESRGIVSKSSILVCDR